jgi:hypothetical protein
MKIRSAVVVLLHADRRTGRHGETNRRMRMRLKSVMQNTFWLTETNKHIAGYF